MLKPDLFLKLSCGHVFCGECSKGSSLICRLPSCATLSRPPIKITVKDSLADIEIELERLKREKEKLLTSKHREIKKMALEFLNECKNQKLVKLDKLKAELKVVKEEICSMTTAFDNVNMPAQENELKSTPKNTDCIKFPKTEQISNNYANILKNFPDLESNYFSTKSKYQSIGQLIYNAFKYESLVEVGKIVVADTPSTRTYVYGMAVGISGMLSVAGTLKTVNIYNPAVEDNPLPVVYPITKLPSNSFTWSSAWNPSSPNLLAVGDYNSEVKIWDVVGKVATNTFHGHAASKYLNVSWTPTKPQQLLSAAYDSAQVRVWRLNERGSVMSIRAPDKLLNLSSKPHSPYHFAVSSIDRNIYSYDIRKADKPVKTLAGHAKSVFQLKFLDSKTLISASVDGTLKQWAYENSQCIKTYKGHQNTVKFIGLDMIGEHLICGSENNSIYLYHEALSKPVMTHQLPEPTSLLGNPAGDGQVRHISAAVTVGEKLCAANDAGVIHILRFSEDGKLRRAGTC